MRYDVLCKNPDSSYSSKQKIPSKTTTLFMPPTTSEMYDCNVF